MQTRRLRGVNTAYVPKALGVVISLVMETLRAHHFGRGGGGRGGRLLRLGALSIALRLAASGRAARAPGSLERVASGAGLALRGPSAQMLVTIDTSASGRHTHILHFPPACDRYRSPDPWRPCRCAGTACGGPGERGRVSSGAVRSTRGQSLRGEYASRCAERFRRRPEAGASAVGSGGPVRLARRVGDR
jgi:hypothetical protein